MKIYYNNFPEKWEDGLPLGNGRLAAMLWGADCDILSLNHEWIWTGNFKKRENQKSAHFLPYVRQYLENGDYFRANALAAVAFGGNGGISPLERRMDSYQPAGELFVHFEESPHSIVRSLEMEKGVVQSRRVFAHHEIDTSAYCDCNADVIAATWKSTRPMHLRLQFVREAQQGIETEIAYTSTGFSFDADMAGGISFGVRGAIKTDGKVFVSDAALSVQDATYVTVCINIGTEHAGIAQELGKTDLFAYQYEKSFALHCAKFAAQMNQSKIEICPTDCAQDHFYLNEHITALKKSGREDPCLLTIYARFAQYLMVSGSICAELPLHLQGKWNRDLCPKWNSDYHLNINLQMNYWFTDRMQLSQSTRQMLEYVRMLLPNARKAAKDIYGCRGILYPLNSDIWANCTAEAYNYAVWIAAAGWLCQHFISHYVHTGDKQYLKTAGYPFIKETVQFYEDYFVRDAQGSLQIMPSQSPENKFEGGGYFPVSICANSAMDVQIAYDTFRFAIFAAEELETDTQNCVRWREMLEHFPPFPIGSDGRLLEWDAEDKIEIEKGHRHVSHLFGVYPANIFSPEKNTEQFKAARKSLDFRLAHAGGHTGWSRAWAACLFARFLDGAAVQENLHKLICEISSATLLDLHPNYYPQTENKKRTDTPALFTKPVENPPMIFQIDGNLGAAAALAEAVAQYRSGKIYLLPAADKSWTHGCVSGMIMPFGNRIDFTWDESGITNLCVTLGFRGKAVFAHLPGIKQQPGITCAETITVTGQCGQKFVLIGE